MKIAPSNTQKSEYHASVVQRYRQTLAVLNARRPSLRVAQYGVAEFAELADEVAHAVVARDTQEMDFREARGAFRIANSALRTLALKVPLLIAGNFHKSSAVARMLPAIWEHVPRTPAVTMQRARALVAIWKKADEALAAHIPAKAPIVLDDVGCAQFAEQMEQVAERAQAMENAAEAFRDTCRALRNQARSLDKLNKRFFSKLKAEARSDSALQSALKQITTEPPSTRGRRDRKPQAPH